MNAKLETQNTTQMGASKLHNDFKSIFKMIRAENLENVVVGTLNINSFLSKADEFKLMVSGLFDVIIVTETKFDDSFAEAQYYIGDFVIQCRLDRNRNEEGLMIYVSDGIPSKMLTKLNLPEDNEAGFIELNFQKC